MVLGRFFQDIQRTASDIKVDSLELKRALRILGVLMLCGMLFFWLSLPLSQRPAVAVRVQPDPNSDPQAAQTYMRQLARRYGDNWSRLTEQDRTLMNSVAMGHGQQLLAKLARETNQPAASAR